MTHSYPLLLPRVYKTIYRMQRSTVNIFTSLLFTYNEDRNYERFCKRVYICLNYFTTHKKLLIYSFSTIRICFWGYKRIFGIDWHAFGASSSLMTGCHWERENFQEQINFSFRILMYLYVFYKTYVICKGYGLMDLNCGNVILPFYEPQTENKTFYKQ